MLEKMGEFFDRRMEGYDEHQFKAIESAQEVYRFTAECLPAFPGCRILDLGCGTGLELDSYLPLNPDACITGIDLAPGMLERLKEKHANRRIELICGSYFDVPFGTEAFDSAVSVMSLHHFTFEEKVPLYSKLRMALKNNGYFILSDYFSLSDEEERQHKDEWVKLKKEQSIADGEFYHFDIPLTAEHETECLRSAGFSSVNILKNWGGTYAIKAVR